MNSRKGNGPLPQTIEPPALPGARERIFAAAEKQIADHGFEAVSIRDIVAEAGVNVAAVNYHYGSKGQLLLEIFRTRAAELNGERSALLKRAVARDPTDARGILRAMVEPPTLWTSPERQIALRYLNRARSEGPAEIQDIIRRDVRHLRRFADALAAALPHLDREEIDWRLHFALGILHHNRPSDYERLAILSDGACRPEDREALLTRLLDFIAAGFGL